MTLIGRVKSLFQKSKPTYKTEFNTTFAFECGGIKYFEFTDLNNLPYQRGLEALTFFQELQNGIDKKYLLEHVEVMNKLLSNPKVINLNEIIKHNARFEERLKFIVSKDIIYKVASIAFVDDTEDLLKYDFKYNEKKIENWKNNGGNAFFLQQPLKRLIPFLNQSGDSSPMYLKAVEAVEELQHKVHSLILLEVELRAEN